MPVPDEERQAWLDRLSDNPIDTAAAVAEMVSSDLESLEAGQHIRVGTRVLTPVVARSFVQSLLTSVDHVEVAAVARQYIATGTIENDGEGLIGINVDN